LLTIPISSWCSSIVKITLYFIIVFDDKYKNIIRQYHVDMTLVSSNMLISDCNLSLGIGILYSKKLYSLKIRGEGRFFVSWLRCVGRIKSVNSLAIFYSASP
jgi:hypothetical protein